MDLYLQSAMSRHENVAWYLEFVKNDKNIQIPLS